MKRLENRQRRPIEQLSAEKTELAARLYKLVEPKDKDKPNFAGARYSAPTKESGDAYFEKITADENLDSAKEQCIGLVSMALVCDP